MTIHLDMSVGPVQDFVAQSRRTRDLWGSSYLLSFLSAHAMRGAKKAGGEIAQPAVDDDPLYRWVSGHREGAPPRVGSLPNRFVVKVDGDAQKVAEAGVDALETAWKRVCKAVWDKFVEHACFDGDGTKNIWHRQIDNFWEVTWTAGSDAERSLLARRKQWRSHSPPDEPGDKCTVMHDLQEISGYVRSECPTSRDGQEQFWKKMRRCAGSLDLRDNERLCAVALVKRLFPRAAVAALGWEVDTLQWPSTVHVGARLWICRVETARPRQAQEYAEAIKRHAPGGVLTERLPPSAYTGTTGDFAKLDANYFHRGFVRSERLCPLNDDAGSARQELDRILNAIYDCKDKSGRRLGSPPSFYALLLADGDRLGKLLGELCGQRVGKALKAFTSEVPKIVQDHYGETVYAGGDDVLAMLPVPHALPCADRLSHTYGQAFENYRNATLSASVLFVHVRLPLRAALNELHRLLEEVAKDGNGRDSLAVGVLKPGGLNCQWVTSWMREPLDGGSASALALLDDLTGNLGSDADEPGLSSALVYRIRETLIGLCGWEAWRPGSWGLLPEGLDIQAFLRAEISHSLAARMKEGYRFRADRLANLVCAALGRSRGPSNGKHVEAGVDALLLARFLANPEDDGSGA